MKKRNILVALLVTLVVVISSKNIFAAQTELEADIQTTEQVQEEQNDEKLVLLEELKNLVAEAEQIDNLSLYTQYSASFLKEYLEIGKQVLAGEVEMTVEELQLQNSNLRESIDGLCRIDCSDIDLSPIADKVQDIKRIILLVRSLNKDDYSEEFYYCFEDFSYCTDAVQSLIINYDNYGVDYDTFIEEYVNYWLNIIKSDLDDMEINYNEEQEQEPDDNTPEVTPDVTPSEETDDTSDVTPEVTPNEEANESSEENPETSDINIALYLVTSLASAYTIGKQVIKK